MHRKQLELYKVPTPHVAVFKRGYAEDTTELPNRDKDYWFGSSPPNDTLMGKRTYLSSGE